MDLTDDLGFGEAPEPAAAAPTGFGEPAGDYDFGPEPQGYNGDLPHDNGYAPADADLFSQAEVYDSAPPPAPYIEDENDPRVQWRRLNAELLAQKEKDEAAAKEQLLQKGLTHTKNFYEQRKTALKARKSTNRENENLTSEATTPVGATTWERVISVIDFNTEPVNKDAFKERTKFKALLFTAKAKNIAIKA